MVWGNARWKSANRPQTICRRLYPYFVRSRRSSPRSVLVLPLIFEGKAKGVLELASFDGFNPSHQAFLDQLTESIGIVLNTIEANMRTEGLLTQSQSLAQQLQSRQEQLQQTNEELAGKSPSPCRTKPRSGAQEPGSGAGPSGTGRQSQTAGPYLQIQIGISAQHAPRIAHAAEQPADPVRPIDQKSGRQPDAQADGSRQDHPQFRQRFAHADQRHS